MSLKYRRGVVETISQLMRLRRRVGHSGLVRVEALVALQLSSCAIFFFCTSIPAVNCDKSKFTGELANDGACIPHDRVLRVVGISTGRVRYPNVQVRSEYLPSDD